MGIVGSNVTGTANYNPKLVQPDSETPIQQSGPVVSSVFGMLRRVYRIEVRTRPRHDALA